MYTVCMHTSKTTGKNYIGITCQTPWTKRFNGDGSGYRNCIHFWNAIKKYGWDDFEHIVLTTCETEKEAMKLERFYIKKYQSNNDEYGYNIKEGGEHQEFPPEVRKHISDALKGKPNGMLGKHHSEETKKRMSEAQKGRKMPKDRYDAMCKRTREYFTEHSPAHTFTEEDHIRAREASRVRVRILETGKEFDSMSECAEYLGVLISNLSRAIHLNKKYKRYHIEKICLQTPNDQSEDVEPSGSKWEAPAEQGEDMI